MRTRTRITAARRPHRAAHHVPAEDGLHATEAERLREENAQLRVAMESRAVIDQALGMVMALAPCDRDAAWRVLVEVSQHTNTKLREIAATLVATTDGATTLSQPLGDTLSAAMRRARTA